MVFPPKPLGFVKEGLNRMGLEISHVYEDLIFPDHSAYLIQFGIENHELNIYFNGDCPDDERIKLKDELISEMAGNIGFSLNFTGSFVMEQDEDEEIKLTFSP
ncbi:MAG: hypothetical protein PQJ50_03060 [Spirochaetales bacterium]|nr:hypothetical protein [Spirochaetales bacterium]